LNYFVELFEYILNFFPRIHVIYPNERGVRIRFGKYVKVLEPGWRIYWPLITDIQKLEVVVQIIDLPVQSLLTKDGKLLAISGAIEYIIVDVEKALLNVQDFDKSLPTLGMGLISEYVDDCTLSQCRDWDKLKKPILRMLRTRAKDWGIQVTRLYKTDLVPHKVYRMMSKASIIFEEE